MTCKPHEQLAIRTLALTMRPLTKFSTPELQSRLRSAIRTGSPVAAELSAILDRRRCRPPKKHRVAVIRQRQPARPFLSWSNSIDDICRRRGLSLDDLMTTSRVSFLSEARYEIWWTIRNQFGTSYERIGERLGGFDHASVLYGVRRWQAALDVRVGRVAA
jgi:hypothetical protein